MHKNPDEGEERDRKKQEKKAGSEKHDKNGEESEKQMGQVIPEDVAGEWES